jgi:hypothetical protein
MSCKTVFAKLMQARRRIHESPMKKSGRNSYSNYDYFELSDFMPATLKVFEDIGLCGVVSFTEDVATLTIVDVDTGDYILITSPMGSANLKGCHEVQNIGAVEKYQRRYLWAAAIELIENDIIDGASSTKNMGPSALSVSADVWNSLDATRRDCLIDMSKKAFECLSIKDYSGAIEELDKLNLDADEKTALWSQFSSSDRRGMKAASASKKRADEL